MLNKQLRYKRLFAGMGRRPIALPTFPQTVTHEDSPGNETLR